MARLVRDIRDEMEQPDTLYDRLVDLVERVPPGRKPRIVVGWRRLLDDVVEGRTLAEPIPDSVLDALDLRDS